MAAFIVQQDPELLTEFETLTLQNRERKNHEGLSPAANMSFTLSDRAGMTAGM
jgi:hypothetical protein